MAPLFTFAVPTVGAESMNHSENAAAHRLASRIVGVSDLYASHSPNVSSHESDDASGRGR